MCVDSLYIHQQMYKSPLIKTVSYTVLTKSNTYNVNGYADSNCNFHTNASLIALTKYT